MRVWMLVLLVMLVLVLGSLEVLANRSASLEPVALITPWK